jgi:hypothetical protein
MTNTAAGWDATIVCEALPQCANPLSGIHLLSVSAESANMGWDENSGATSWKSKSHREMKPHRHLVRLSTKILISSRDWKQIAVTIFTCALFVPKRTPPGQNSSSAPNPTIVTGSISTTAVA